MVCRVGCLSRQQHGCTGPTRATRRAFDRSPHTIDVWRNSIQRQLPHSASLQNASYGQPGHYSAACIHQQSGLLLVLSVVLLSFCVSHFVVQSVVHSVPLPKHAPAMAFSLDTLAQIFDGSVSFWFAHFVHVVCSFLCVHRDDPLIAADNPKLASSGLLPHAAISKVIPVDVNNPEWSRKPFVFGLF